MPIKGPSVFLDANIVIRAGKPPGGPEIDRVGDLVDAGFVKFLTTDLTVTEVVKKHADNDYEVVKEIARPHFRKISEDVVGVKIEKISKTDIREKLRAIYHESVSKMFNRLKAHRLEIDAVNPLLFSQVMQTELDSFQGKERRISFQMPSFSSASSKLRAPSYQSS